MYNSITVVGRLCADPELRYGQTGTARATFTVAVDRSRKDQEGNKVTDFLEVTTWKGLAENCARFLAKGKLALITGELHVEKWEKDGMKHSVPKISADNVKFLSPKDNSLGREVDPNDHPF